MTARYWILAAALASLVGCSSRNGNNDNATCISGCKSDQDCRAGRLCSRCACMKLCNRDTDCDVSQSCTDSFCVAVAMAVPVIADVDGDGSETSHATDKGTATRHRVRTAIRVSGSGLKFAKLVLVNAEGMAFGLRALTQADRLVVADLPAVLTNAGAAGQYTLRANNLAGEATATVWVLKGEDGVSPSVASVAAAAALLHGDHDAMKWGRMIEAETGPLSASVDTMYAVKNDIGSALGGGYITASAAAVESVPFFRLDSRTYQVALAALPVRVHIRMMVTDNTSGTPITAIRCISRHADTSETKHDEKVINGTGFLAINTWQDFTLTCAFALDDDNQFIEADFHAGATLAIDYVRLVPLDTFTP